MTTVITKNSSTASAVPASGDLVQGELAVNVTDKKIFTKDSSGTVVKVVGQLGNQEPSAVAITGGTVAGVAQTGGTINNTPIGATTANAITGTLITATTGFSGPLTGAVTGNTTGTHTGAVVGNVTGNLTGNVTASSGSSTFNNVTINGTLDMDAASSATITNLPSPTNSGDAANKSYVDTQISNLVASAPSTLDTLNELATALGNDASFSTTVTTSIATKLPLAGGTMSGNIAMGTNKVTGLGTPSSSTDAATKGYVDTADSLLLPLAGGTMTGNIVMGSNKVTSTATPTTDNDLTRKAYVDSILGSATAAATSAAAAATSETNAANSASSASTSASNASASASAAAASYDSFDDRYLGAKSSAPSVDNDGNALLTGALYWNSTSNELYLWTGSAWTRSALSGTDYVAKSGDTMTGALVVDVNTSTDALRITQTGAGNALVVEDSANPDSTPFVVDASGRMGIGVTPTGGSSGEKLQIAQTTTATTTTTAAYTQHNVSATSGSAAYTANTASLVTTSAFAGTGVLVASASGATNQTANTLSDLRLFNSTYTSTGGGVATSISHYQVGSTTLTSGTVTSQYGFNVPSSFTGATNNYGFYGNIASGTGRYNLYMAGTAANYMAGALGIGASLTQVNFYNTRNISGNSVSYGNYLQATAQSDVTSAVHGYRSNISTAAASFSVSSIYNFYAGQGTIGAGSTVTSQYGFVVDSSLTGATNNYGFYGDIAAGTGRYNFYAAGTARNYFAGGVEDSYGNLRAVPPVGTKTSSYTLATTDVGRYVQVSTGGSIVIPDATFSEGDVVSVFNNTSGTITITCSITTAYIAGTDSDKATMTLAARGVATFLFISGTICVASGNLT